MRRRLRWSQPSHYDQGMEDFFAGARQWSLGEVAALLTAKTALTTLTLADAREVVKRMRPSRIPAGTVLLREGEKHVSFMLFILEGEALVESVAAGHGESMVLKTVGPGSLIGEQGILDNKARSATVTAASDMAVAVMDQEAFARLVDEVPKVACSVLAEMLRAVSERLREANHRMHMLTRINQAMEAQIEAMAQEADSPAAPRPEAPRAGAPDLPTAGDPAYAATQRL